MSIIFKPDGSRADALYNRHYKAILIDWPRKYTSWVANANPESDRSVERHYKVMKRRHVLQWCREYIPKLAHPDGCHIFNWSSSPFDWQTHEEFAAMGARYSSIAFYWLKMKPKFADGQIALTTTDIDELEDLMFVGMGHTTRKNIEHVKLARIGSPKRKSRSVRELIIAPLRENSRKPDEIHERIEEYCDGPYLELFGRKSRPGWTVFGDEADKFDKPQPRPERKVPERAPVEPPDPNQIAMFDSSTEFTEGDGK